MTPTTLSDFDDERIARLLAGELGPADREVFEAEAAARPELLGAVDAARAGWMAAGASDAVDVDAAWSKVRARIHAPDANVLQFPQKARYWRSTATWMRAAAAVAVFVGGVAVWRSVTSSPTEGVVARTSPVAQQSVVNLPDGSVVVLSAASSLRTREGFGGSMREVELVGEARFTVTHDEKRPFRVHAAGALVEDLGTVFVVRALPRQPVRVAVTEGSVSLRRAGAPDSRAVILAARDMAELPDTGDVVVSRGGDVDHLAAWTRGQLAFRNTRLADAIVDLERWFDVEFALDDPVLLARPLNVTIEQRMTVDGMLDLLGTMVDVEFQRRGRTVTVAPPVRTGMLGGSAARVGSGV